MTAQLTNQELHELLRLALTALRGGGLQAPGGQALADLAEVPQARTLSEWLITHDRLLTERGYKDQTLKNRRAVLKHVLRIWGAVGISDLKPHRISADLKQFLPDRSALAVRVLSELRDAYTEAVANGWCETNPAAHVRSPRHKVLRQRLKFEVWQQMRELSKACSQRWLESLLLLALVTGQRRADLAKMAFSDIVDNCIRIEQQKQAGKGYGARVAIPLALRLNAIGMTVGEVIEHCRHSAKPGPTLLRKAGGGDIEMSSLSARFAECIHAVLGDADPGARLRPSLHEVRSLSARLYTQQGIDVQILLGHKHAEMTDLYKDDRGLSAHEWKVVPLTERTHS